MKVAGAVVGATGGTGEDGEEGLKFEGENGRGCRMVGVGWS